ncbi:MAG: transglycosylase domain-containing protein [Thermodesulfobacteriota bacterium]|nr:transglycosylase domain-containing protein [Thermodesulfobacteriota bacterium]
MMKKKTYLIGFIAFIFLLPLILFGYTYYEVTLDASTRIQKGVIQNIIRSESPVYYDDKETPIGVFFEKTHRKYIDYKEIPKVFIKAIIAAEDRDFFNHHGFDAKAILRALISNIRAGKVVQGGSTITQQTAKNVFKRERRSYRAKLKELIQAFLLEREYSKQDILEMYSNQFFVTGYGKGLMIAAQYYFNKDAKDLDLVEAAFIAGSVKGPNRYNPFIKKTGAEKKEARKQSKLRKDYVLAKMMQLDFITQEQYLEAIQMEVPFNEGRVTYKLNVILDYVREQLMSDFFKAVLEEQGVDNPATSGIRIYTSINKDVQEAALRSLRDHLPLFDVRLNGYNIAEMSDSYYELLEKGIRKSTDHFPFPARITHIGKTRKDPHLVVSWDHGGGIIDYEGLRPIGDSWLKSKKGLWAEFGEKHIPSFLKNFSVGDVVPVQVISSGEKDAGSKVFLSKIPELEGGIVVLHKGMLKAMVGGYLNRYFNRSVDAKRQLGSIFKPIVYGAALQLKWNTLDSLRNREDVFRFENTYYVPRPDHEPMSENVSMMWAGAKSENLATIWLLYHLTDRLNLEEFREVADLVDLTRRSGESYPSYKTRIRDVHGVVVDEHALMEAAFEQSKGQVQSDVIFSGHEEMLPHISRMQFDISEKSLNAEGIKKREFQRFCYQRLIAHDLRMKTKLKRLVTLSARHDLDGTLPDKEALSKVLEYFYFIETEDNGPKVVYVEDRSSLSQDLVFPLTLEWLKMRSAPLSPGDIWIDGLVTSEILGTIKEHMNRNFRRLISLKRYDLDVLWKIRDFRTLVNMFYVIHFSKKIGISTELEAVLSFPLGPNSISIIEGARAYQTIMTGEVYPFPPTEGLDQVPIITKIVDREGETLWEYEANPQEVLSGRVSRLVMEILEKVMTIGTGSLAAEAVRVFDIPIPSFGKTGTANQFTNSSFIGMIPGPDKTINQLNLKDGYVIAAYVGYDDNRPMKGKAVTIYGASGALPLWIDTARAIVGRDNYKECVQPADLAFDSSSVLWSNNEDFRVVPVSPLTGLHLEPGVGKTVEPPKKATTFAEVDANGDRYELKRRFEPLREKNN